MIRKAQIPICKGLLHRWENQIPGTVWCQPTKNYLFWKENKPGKRKQQDAPMFLPFPHLLSDAEHLQTYGKVDEGL